MRGDNRAEFTIDVETAAGQRNLNALAAAAKQTSNITASETAKQTGLWAGLGASVGMAATLIIGYVASIGKAFVTSSVNIAIQREAILRSFEVLLGGADKAKAAFDRLQESAKLPGVTFESALSGAQKLLSQSNPLSFDDTVRTIEAFGNAAALGGQSAREMELALRGLGQMMGKGKITAEEMNQQILEAIPMLRKGLDEAFNTSNVEKLAKDWKDSGRDINEFILLWVDGLEKAVPRATQTGALSIQNLGIAVQNAKAAFGKGLIGDDVIKNVNELAGGVEDLTDNLQDLGEWVNRRGTPALKNLMNLFKGLTSDTGTWLDKLKAVGSFLASGVMEYGVGQFFQRTQLPMPTHTVDRYGNLVPRPTGNEPPINQGMGGLRVAESRMAAPAAPSLPPPSTTGGEVPGPGRVAGTVAPIDAAAMAAEAKKNEIAARDAWIDKLKQAKDMALAGDAGFMKSLGPQSVAELDQWIMGAVSKQFHEKGMNEGDYRQAVFDLNTENAQRAEQAREDARQKADDARRQAIMRGDTRLDMAQTGLDRANVLMDTADGAGGLARAESERARALGEVKRAMQDQIALLTQYGELAEAARLEVQLLRLEEEQRKKATLGSEILGANSPAAVDAVLRRNGITQQNFTGAESMIGGAMQGAFGGDNAKAMTDKVATALAQFVADMLINSMRGFGVMP